MNGATRGFPAAHRRELTGDIYKYGQKIRHLVQSLRDIGEMPADLLTKDIVHFCKVKSSFHEVVIQRGKNQFFIALLEL